MNSAACARYQLLARATYLPKGHLVAEATYLRCATVHQASVSVDRQGDLSRQASVRRLGWQCSDVGAQEAIGPNAHQGAPIGKVGSLQSTKVFGTRLSVLGGKNNTR